MKDFSGKFKYLTEKRGGILMMGGYDRHYEIHAMIGKQFTRIGAMPLNMIEGACLGPFL